jgi:hypothetical protein
MAEVCRRLYGRFNEMGFQRREPKGTQFPAGTKDEYCRRRDDVEESIFLTEPYPTVMAIPGSGNSGEVDVTLVNVRYQVRSVRRGPLPTYGQVLHALPSLKPPPIGQNAIPDAALSLLADRQVTMVWLTGNDTMYNYVIDVPAGKSGRQGEKSLPDQLSGVLRTHGLAPQHYFIGGPLPGTIVDLSRTDRTKPLLVAVQKQGDEYRVRFVLGSG